MLSSADEKILRITHGAEKFKIQDLRLVESFCKLEALKDSNLPGNAKQTVRLEYNIDLGNKVVIAIAGFGLIFSYDPSDKGEPPIAISAKFRISYAFEDEVNTDLLKEVVESLAVANAWPYWRELAQSMTVRMGLPALPMPIINPIRLKNETAESQAEKENKEDSAST